MAATSNEMEGTAGIGCVGAAGGGPVINLSGKQEDTILVQIALMFLLPLPTIWCYFVVQLGQAGPLKSKALVSDCEMHCNFVGLNWGESLYPGFFKGVCGDWFVELSIARVRPINRLKRYKLGWVR
jgi:hypothetical protein